MRNLFAINIAHSIDKDMMIDYTILEIEKKLQMRFEINVKARIPNTLWKKRGE